MTDHITRAELLAALERASDKWRERDTIAGDGTTVLDFIAAELRRDPVATCDIIRDSNDGSVVYGTCGNPLPCPLHPAPKPTHGVWCVQDRAFCAGTEGTEAHALAELPRWQSGEAAAVDPRRFHYEVRPLHPAPKPLDLLADVIGPGARLNTAAPLAPVPRVRITRSKARPVTLDDSDEAPVPRGHCGRCDRCGEPYLGHATCWRCWRDPVPSLSHCAGCGAPYQADTSTKDERCNQGVLGCAIVHALSHPEPKERHETPRPSPAQRPDLYECEACSAKTGSPSLCARCVAARTAAGTAWVGPRWLWRQADAAALPSEAEAALRVEVERLRADVDRARDLRTLARDERIKKLEARVEQHSGEAADLRAARDRALAVLEECAADASALERIDAGLVVARVREALKLP